MASRRALLGRIAGLAGTVGLAGCSQFLRPARSETDLGLDPNPHAEDLPNRQHAQSSFVRRDEHGNPLLPRRHRLLLLELDASPSKETGRAIERAMRTLEDAFEWVPDGLFHLLAWGPNYFERVNALDAAPVRRPEVLSRTDDPDLLDFDAALVLSSDVPSHLNAAENAMFGRRSSVGDVSVEDRLSEAFSTSGRRTGFTGEGLPVEHTDAEGIPADPPLSDADRMFMGFRSGMRGTQASEDRVTIDSGSFEGGTTMHLSHLTQSLTRWFDGLDQEGRVARMFSPEFTDEDVTDFTDSVPFSDAVEEHASEHDVVGHHEKVARVREDDEPIILRRDFNTVDGGRAGVHFLSFQASLDDFEKTRKSMNGWYLRDDSDDIRDQQNNGILEFITVKSRANFYVPTREYRALPMF
jgi:hypothetical protein